MTDQKTQEEQEETTDIKDDSFILDDIGQKFIKDAAAYDPNKPKIIKQSDEWYFSDKTYMSNSNLKMIRDGGPERMKAFLDGLIPRKESDAYDFGGAFHCMLCEPELFNDRYFIFDDEKICIEIGGAKPRATNKYKEWYQQMEQSAKGKTIIDKETFNHCVNMSEKVMMNESIVEMLIGCNFEEIITNDWRGVKIKSKIDCRHKENHFFLDIKTTKDPVTLENVKRTIFKLGYHRQMGFYSYNTQIKSCWMLFVEKSYPYSVGLFEISEKTLALGWQEIERDLTTYKKYFVDEPELLTKPMSVMGYI